MRKFLWLIIFALLVVGRSTILGASIPYSIGQILGLFMVGLIIAPIFWGLSRFRKVKKRWKWYNWLNVASGIIVFCLMLFFVGVTIYVGMERYATYKYLGQEHKIIENIAYRLLPLILIIWIGTGIWGYVRHLRKANLLTLKIWQTWSFRFFASLSIVFGPINLLVSLFRARKTNALKEKVEPSLVEDNSDAREAIVEDDKVLELANQIVSEKLIVKVDRSSWIASSFVVSPNSKRTAYVTEIDKKEQAIIDGKSGKQYNIIGALEFSPDSQHIVYTAIDSSKKCFVVIDETEEKHCDFVSRKSLIFSPNSKRMAYECKSGSRSFVIVDGKDERPYDAIVEDTLIFSPDSNHIAYAARLGKWHKEWFLVVDGKEETQDNRIKNGAVYFTPDSKRIACVMQVGVGDVLVVAGKQGRVYDEILLGNKMLGKKWKGTLVFSPDHNHVAYGARKGDKAFLVVDGVEGRQYDAISEDLIIFSPDSSRLAYVAQEGKRSIKKRQSVVIDGEDQKFYHGIGEKSLIFSSDSKRIAYAAYDAESEKWFVVTDGVEGRRYDRIAKGSLLFSPDSKRIAYTAGKNEKMFIVVDGKEGKEYAGIAGNSLVFSPDSKRIAYAALEKGKWFVVMDEEEGKHYDRIVSGDQKGIIFDSSDSLHYYAELDTDKGIFGYLVEHLAK